MNIFSPIYIELRDWLEFIILFSSGSSGNFLRNFYYIYRSKTKFENNIFEIGLRIEYSKNVKISSNSYYGLNCKIYASKTSSIKIEKNISFNSES